MGSGLDTKQSGTVMSSSLESLTREELEQLQLRRVNRQVERLWEGNEFYKRIWRDAGLEPGAIDSMEDFRRLPVIDKQQVLADQEAEPPYGHRLGVPESRVF